MILVGAGGHADDIGYTIGDHVAYAHHRDVPALPAGEAVIIGINDPRLRAKVAAELGVIDKGWVHPTAYIGEGSVIFMGAHVNYGVTMTRTKLGAHCTISPGATICGDVVIGDRVLIGAGSTICDRVTIGDDATVGAGAVVLPETIIPAGETWVGVPARKVRP